MINGFYSLLQSFPTTSSGTLHKYLLLLLVSVSVYFEQHLKLEIGGHYVGLTPPTNTNSANKSVVSLLSNIASLHLKT